MNRLLVVFILCAVNVFGQSIKVTVNDNESGLPVRDVHIRVMNSAIATVTDEKGQFEIRSLLPGTKLVLSAVGYAQVVCPLSDTTTRITLVRSTTYLDNITITARRFEEHQFKVSEAITIVNGRELQHTSPRSTPEALMGTTGVWVQKTNHGGGSPIIRGLVGNQVLLMVDGIRMNNATYRYGPNQYLATIDPGLIERIETIRGSGSVLYGSDALGGVVQVISKTPYFQRHHRLRGSVNAKWMSAGMEKSARGELRWNNDNVAALGGISYRDFGNIVAGGSLGTLDPTGYSEMAGDAKVLIRTGSEGIITAAWQHHQQEEVPRYDQVTQGGYTRYNFDPQIRQLGYIRWERSTGNELFNNLLFTAALNRSVEGIKSQKSGTPEMRDQKDIVNTFSVMAEVHSNIARYWQSQTGIEWYYDVIDSKAKVTNISTNEQISVRGSYADGATSNSLAAFSMHTIELNKISISAGARFNAVVLKVDDTTFGSQKVSPNAFVGSAGLAYKIHQNYRLFVGANSGFRAPNVDDVSKFGPVESNVFEIPSENLSPERSFSMEAGVKVSTDMFSGSVAAYHTKLYDLIERIPSTFLGQETFDNRRVYQKQNTNESSVRGIEADGEIKFSSGFSLYGNITYTYGENISKDEPMRRIPPLFGRISFRYHHTTSGFWARADYVATSEQSRLAPGDLSDARISVRLEDGVMPGWRAFNVYAGYSYKFLAFAVSGQNLFDEAYRVYASGVDGYGRSLSLSLTARL